MLPVTVCPQGFTASVTLTLVLLFPSMLTEWQLSVLVLLYISPICNEDENLSVSLVAICFPLKSLLCLLPFLYIF